MLGTVRRVILRLPVGRSSGAGAAPAPFPEPAPVLVGLT
jgi:hypothetical protein